MAPQISIALVGGGLIGPRHAEHIISSPDCRLSAFVDPSSKGQAQAQAWNVPYYKSVTDMLEANTDIPDAAVVATPNHTHVALTTELVNAGVHVLVEKPVSASIADGKSLLELTKKTEKGAKVLVGHHRRFNLYIVSAKNVISSGKLGDITAISGLWTLRKPLEYSDAPTEWRRSTASGGGPILTNFIHDVDILQYLFGPVSSVYAVPTPSRRGFEVEEGCAMTITFTSGLVGTFLCCDNVASPYDFESGTGENPTIPKTGKDFLKVFGTQGTLSLSEGVWIDQGGWTEEIKWEKIGGSGGEAV